MNRYRTLSVADASSPSTFCRRDLGFGLDRVKIRIGIRVAIGVKIRI